MDIKNVRLVPNTLKEIFKISLCLTLMVFVLTMTPASTFFQITKPAEAAPLTSVKISPTNNIVNTRTTYDIFFVTATTGTIKFIDIAFPSGFSVDTATIIERSGIGTGSLSAQSANVLIYSVTNPVSVPAGTTIRLQIAKILNSFTEDDTTRLTLTTENANFAIIDGPTNSFSFPIKSIETFDIADETITANDVSPDFMIRKTLLDDPAGNAKGWDPDGNHATFTISDVDAISNPDERFVGINTFSVGGSTAVCQVTDEMFGDAFFTVVCDRNVEDGTDLHYVIFNEFPPHVVTSSSSLSVSESTISSPFNSIGPND